MFENHLFNKAVSITQHSLESEHFIVSSFYVHPWMHFLDTQKLGDFITAKYIFRGFCFCFYFEARMGGRGHWSAGVGDKFQLKSTKVQERWSPVSPNLLL